MRHLTPPLPPRIYMFFTVRLAHPSSDLLIREVDRLRHATRITRDRFPFEIDEIVVLPSVIHTIWAMPHDDCDASKRWRMLKSQFSRGVSVTPPVTNAVLRRGDKGIWQRRFWEHALHEANDLTAHREMILDAPVQAGLAWQAQDWQHSSIHRAIRNGRYDPVKSIHKRVEPVRNYALPI
jgi:putative transposase